VHHVPGVRYPDVIERCSGRSSGITFVRDGTAGDTSRCVNGSMNTTAIGKPNKYYILWTNDNSAMDAKRVSLVRNTTANE
jgi:hypothetical protein